MRWLNLSRHWHLKNCSEPIIKQTLSTPWPRANLNWRETSMLAIDLEMTGLEASNHEIVSLGWVAIDHGNIQLNSIQRWLVKPENSVGSSATIHYLRDEDLQSGTALTHGLTALATAMAGRVCIFHNKRLDTQFLNNAFKQQFGIPWCWPTIDTMKLEWRRIERRNGTLDKETLRLNECRKRYHLPDYPLHDASQDALACAELFVAWASHSGGKGPTLNDCLKWSR